MQTAWLPPNPARLWWPAAGQAEAQSVWHQRGHGNCPQAPRLWPQRLHLRAKPLGGR